MHDWRVITFRSDLIIKVIATHTYEMTKFEFHENDTKQGYLGNYYVQTFIYILLHRDWKRIQNEKRTLSHLAI
jgi:hypothetical protein